MTAGWPSSPALAEAWAGNTRWRWQARGAKVVVNDFGRPASEGSKEGNAADAVVAEIRAAGGTALANHASVTDEAAVSQMVKDTLAAWGRVDILVNNAGILRDKSFGKMTLDDFRAVVAVHLMGAVVCTHAVWNTMRAQQYGRVVMTTSSSGLYGNFGQANYGAAKMALVGLMQTLAIEGAKDGIRVNCLGPHRGDAHDRRPAATPDAGAVDARLGDAGPAGSGVAGCADPHHPVRRRRHLRARHVTMTHGVHIGSGADAAERVAAHFSEISSRAGETVPESGSAQVHNELAHAMAARALTHGAADGARQRRRRRCADGRSRGVARGAGRDHRAAAGRVAGRDAATPGLVCRCSGQRA